MFALVDCLEAVARRRRDANPTPTYESSPSTDSIAIARVENSGFDSSSTGCRDVVADCADTEESRVV